MAQLIFATGNAGKMREIREILSDLPLEVKSMKEAGINVDVVEDGTTFEENALIKARAIHAVSGGIVLADDSGLVVDYMDGMPGIYSARFMGEDTSYDIKNQAIIDALEKAEGEERSARFVCAIAAVLPDGSERVVRATMEGRIGYEIAGANGFGYDPVFYLPEYKKTSAEISPAEKNAISHRGKALRLMKEQLKEALS